MSRRITLIFDINGTLLSRHPRSDESMHKISDIKTILKKSISKDPNFTLHGYWYYFRPHVRELLQYCFKNFHVGVWTSSLPMTAYPVVAHLFGSSLDLSQVILDDGKKPKIENFPCSLEDAESLQKTYESSLQQLRKTNSNYSFNFMNSRSVNSLEEKLLRCNMIKTLYGLKQENSHDSHSIPFKLCLLWTRRRCILRSTSVMDDPIHFKHKPVAIKDLGQLWKYRGFAKEDYMPLSNDYYKRGCSLLNRLVVGKENNAAFLEQNSESLPIPFYYPQFGCINRDQFHSGRTLIIDDASIKFGLHLNNGLAIPEYNVLDDPLQQDQTLTTLIRWLELLKKYEMTHQDVDDLVPSFIQNHSFRS